MCRKSVDENVSGTLSAEIEFRKVDPWTGQVGRHHCEGVGRGRGVRLHATQPDVERLEPETMSTIDTVHTDTNFKVYVQLKVATHQDNKGAKLILASKQAKNSQLDLTLQRQLRPVF
jgi:hypothetical protein